MKKYIFLFASVLLVMMSCRKDKQEVIIDENPHEPIILDGYEPATEMITASVFGTVLNELGEPFPNAQVKLNDITISSDMFGAFKFENVSMNKLGQFVEVAANDYFKSGRRFYPLNGSLNNVRIEMIPIKFDKTFDSNTASTISINGAGGSIDFEANSIGFEDGSPFDGTVQIATYWLSPSSFETINQMPGALQGVTLENEEIGLTSYGMVGVELQNANGQKLNIIDGKTATIKLNVPTALQSAAPQQIPLWSFNYEYGIWVEESSATLIDGQYVGEVSHFSFWNCDDPEELIFMDLKTVDAITGGGIQGSTVVITTLSGSISSGTGTTGVNGVASGFIPKDVNLMLEIFSPCGDLIYSEEIGPYSEDTSLGEFEIEGSVSIRGSIVDCENQPVENPILVVESGNQTFHYPVSNNPFLTRVLVCTNASTIEVAGGNLTTFEQGSFVSTDVVPSIDVGELAACGEELIGYFKITVEGTTTRYFEINNTAQAPDQSTPYVTQMFMWNQSNVNPGDTLQASIGFASGGSGFANYAADWSATDFIDLLLDSENGWLFSTSDGFDTFIVTEYGDTPGSIFRGHASGNLTNMYNGGSTDVFVECEFVDFWE